MTTALESDLTISYEGTGEVTELMGGHQANFLVRRPGMAAKEVAVILNSAASAVIAKELDTEDDAAFRDNAARIAGRIAVERMFEQYNRLDSFIFVSAGSLREDPVILSELKRLLAAATAMAHERMAPQH